MTVFTSIARRTVLVCAGAAFLPVAGVVQAQDAPVRMVVPFGAGTTTDNVSRIVAEAMGKALKQTVIVENRSGAGGSTGTDSVARAPADGRTVVMGTVGTHAINAALFRKLPYDPQKNFAPIAFVGYTPLLLVVPANSSVKSPKDLLTMAQRKDGITFASAGNGTSGHLAGELLAKLGGKMIHVPYKDGTQAMTDLMSGNVDFMFYHPTAVVPHMKAGKLRALGVSSTVRTPLAADVKTLAEQGFSDFDLIAWFMLYAPETQARLVAQGVELRRMRGDELAAFNSAEIGKWSELVKRSGAQVD